MQTIYMVIVDCGDGSQTIEWHKTWSDEKHKKLEVLDPYMSGDGLQLRELLLPDNLNLNIWAEANNIVWFEDDEWAFNVK